jgi:predicted MPP superfamily phosphohydrolase
MFKFKPFHKLIIAAVSTIAVFFILRYALPKPKMMTFVLMSIIMIDVWIDYWIRLNKTQLPQRTCKIVLRIFYASIACFTAMILAFWICPVAYWTPVLRTYVFGVVLILASLKIILAMFLLVQFFISKLRFANKIASSKRWFQVGLWMIVGMFAVALYGTVYEVFALRVQRIEIEDRAVPKAFDGYKIVQFSDMHIGTQVSGRYIKKLVDSINAQEPDLVVFTGDMVNFYTDEAFPFVPLLSEIRAKDGVYAILGNHDYGGYLNWKTPKDSADNMQKMMDMYQSLNWRVLQNENIMLYRANDSIVLAGVDNYSSKKSKRHKSLADTKKALLGTSPSDFVVMLSHSPQHFDEELQTDYPYVNLTLAGHSHGGQMALGIGKYQFSVSQFSMKYWRGFHHIDNQYLNVNTGCGFNALPFRINMPPSISVIVLKR